MLISSFSCPIHWGSAQHVSMLSQIWLLNHSVLAWCYCYLSVVIYAICWRNFFEETQWLSSLQFIPSVWISTAEHSLSAYSHLAVTPRERRRESVVLLQSLRASFTLALSISLQLKEVWRYPLSYWSVPRVSEAELTREAACEWVYVSRPK